MDYQNIRYESLGRVARLSHARPQRRNAQNVELLDELDHALQHAVADPEIRVIVIAGEGDHFSAGHDLKDAAMHRRQINPEDRGQTRWITLHNPSVRNAYDQHMALEVADALDQSSDVRSVVVTGSHRESRRSPPDRSASRVLPRSIRTTTPFAP